MTTEARLYTIGAEDVGEVHFSLPNDITLEEKVDVMKAGRTLAGILQQMNGLEGPIAQEIVHLDSENHIV